MTMCRTWTSDLWQTRSTLLTGPRGSVVFDPTFFPREVGAICDAATRAADGGERAIVYTHGDWDHVVAARETAGWRAWGHRHLADKPAAARRAVTDEIAAFDAKWYVPRAEPRFPPVTPVTDGETRPVAGLDLTFFEVPGHTDDSVLTVVPDERLIVAGDLLSALEFPFVGFGVAAYRATLTKVARLVEQFGITRLIPGHGPDAPDAGEIARRLDDDRAYLDALEQTARAGGDADATEADLTAAAERVTFRGQAVPPAQTAFHVANLRLAVAEVR